MTTEYSESRNFILSKTSSYVTEISNFYNENLKISFSETDLFKLIYNDRRLPEMNLNHLYGCCIIGDEESINFFKIPNSEEISYRKVYFTILVLLSSSSRLSHQLRVLKYFSDLLPDDILGYEIKDYASRCTYWVKVSNGHIIFRDAFINKNIDVKSIRRLFKKVKNSKFKTIYLQGVIPSDFILKYLTLEGNVLGTYPPRDFTKSFDISPKSNI